MSLPPTGGQLCFQEFVGLLSECGGYYCRRSGHGRSDPMGQSERFGKDIEQDSLHTGNCLGETVPSFQTQGEPFQKVIVPEVAEVAVRNVMKFLSHALCSWTGVPFLPKFKSTLLHEP